MRYEDRKKAMRQAEELIERAAKLMKFATKGTDYSAEGEAVAATLMNTEEPIGEIQMGLAMENGDIG